MKLQNTYIKQKVAFINIMLLIVLLICLMLNYLNINILKKEDDIIVIISLLALLYMSYLGCPYFKYDSEGETLILKNEKSFFPTFLVREKQSDFPKRKLKKFAIKNKFLLKKRLEIYIFSTRVQTGQTKIYFDISYLTKKQIKDLNFSLNKVINDNQQFLEEKQRKQIEV
ncbi:hypothetical protein [Apibacter adventoris]|uniref:Uncharacterized protein n=1 Tax=Apibacter adventoris TaxID=1679466 RepID=A0A2S8A8H0_9FLAO|nr:hypothetical protein [Apibacter adventoris]PQL90853.1 hypothetical protein C4S77_10400 [Apibacter adventoris]